MSVINIILLVLLDVSITASVIMATLVLENKIKNKNTAKAVFAACMRLTVGTTGYLSVTGFGKFGKCRRTSK